MQNILTLPLRQESFLELKNCKNNNNQTSYGITDWKPSVIGIYRAKLRRIKRCQALR
jgi:hypothetical protein